MTIDVPCVAVQVSDALGEVGCSEPEGEDEDDEEEELDEEEAAKKSE